MNKTQERLNEQINKINESWGYEIKDWMDKLQSQPIREVKTGDHSASYEMNRMHTFELMDGRFVNILESGCSCYDNSWATMDFFPTEKEALEKWAEWDKKNIGDENR